MLIKKNYDIFYLYHLNIFLIEKNFLEFLEYMLEL